MINKLPEKYKQQLELILECAKNIFDDNLINIILGGSGGKGNIIENWSDLDIYIIFKEYNKEQIINFLQSVKKEEIHVGTTYYTENEFKNGIIDLKTKVMLYEKQNYNVNPTLYGEDIELNIDLEDIKFNDKINFPNILHEFRRLYINLSMSKENKVEKSYIKKMLVLMKTILRSKYSEFSYGYLQTLNLLYETMEKEGYALNNNSHFDIMDVINDMGNSKEQILKFSEILLGFAEVNIEKEGVKVYGKKN